MMDPITTGGALLFYSTMSNLLRQPSVLKMVTASREPGADTISAVLRDIQTATQKANLQGMFAQEGPAQLSPEAREEVRQVVNFPLPQLKGISSVIPNVSPASAATSAGTIDPTNPIVNPNPATQAVAQTLNQRPPS